MDLNKVKFSKTNEKKLYLLGQFLEWKIATYSGDGLVE